MSTKTKREPRTQEEAIALFGLHAGREWWALNECDRILEAVCTANRGDCCTLGIGASIEERMKQIERVHE